MVRSLSFVACLLAAGLVLAQTGECAGGPPGWIQAEGTGCKLWSPCRQLRETITWSGTCVNDFAEGSGVLQEFLEGKLAAQHEGNAHSGRLSGFGVSILSNGDRYVGEWRDSSWHGHGSYVYSGGDRYVGEWRNGLPSGRGVYTWASGDRHDGEIRIGELTGRGVHTWAARETDNPAIWYEGDFVDGEFHGYGIMLFSNGDWYKGEWRNGRPNGHGTMQFVDGYTYTGTWRDGCVRQGKYMAWIDASEAECEARLSQD